jgi:membrane associated rhomboid family serine protease
MLGTLGIRPWTSYSLAARKALFVAFGLLAVCLIVQFVNSAEHYRVVDEFGLWPRSVGRLPDMAFSCFVHLSWEHFEGNSVFLVIFGFLAAYQGLGKFVMVTTVVMVTSGLYWWLYGTAGLPAAGASGMIWGWVGYSLIRGVFHPDELDLERIVVLAVIYGATSLDLVFPGGAEWQAHIGGLLGGIVCGFALRNHPASLAVRPRRTVTGLTTEAEPPGKTDYEGNAEISQLSRSIGFY